MKYSFTTLVIQFLFAGMLVASTNAKSQNLNQLRVALHLKKATVKESLLLLQKQSGIKFTLFNQILDSEQKKITLSESKISVSEALKEILSGTRLQYKLVNEFVVVEEKPRPPEYITIKGIVTDAKTKETLPGVSIKIKGQSTGGTITDPNGAFSIKVPEEGATLVFLYIGYQNKNYLVNKSTPFISVALQPSSQQLNEVLVTASRKRNTEASVLEERKNSATVQDAISARQIEKTASITTTQALQRVSGVTITDDKYVAIRGLGDRSVIATLNGARLSSSSPDRSAVPLDLVPAALLDNITVYKTSTPDRPADASGGMVELKTKSIPEKLTLEFTAQSGFNSNVGLAGKYNGFYNDDLGFFGQDVNKKNLSPDFLNLAKQYPGGLVDIQKMFIASRNSPEQTQEAYRVSRIMQSFDPILTTTYKKADPNQVYSISFGNSYEIGKEQRLGIIVSANYYQRSDDLYGASRNQYSLYQGIVTGNSKIFNQLGIPYYINPNSPVLDKYLGYNENSGTKTLNYGGLVGLTYHFDNRNEIQAQFLGSRGAEALGNNLTGQWTNTGLEYPVYNMVNQLRQSYRTFTNYNFQGVHKLLETEFSPKLSYNFSASESTQNDPDFRSTNIANLRTISFQNQDGVGIGSDYYTFVSGLANGVGDKGITILADPNGRQYRYLSENNYNLKVDLAQPVKIAGKSIEFKVGGNYLRRNRNFTSNVLGLPGSVIGGGDLELLNRLKGNLNSLISTKYVGLVDPSAYDQDGQPRIGGFLYQIRKSPNNYTGYYETRAFYGMIDARLTENLRLTGGVRFESTDISASIDTTNVLMPATPNLGYMGNSRLTNISDQPNTGYVQNYKPYYSANLTYTLKQDMNFRLAYSTSLARPELRELTNIFDFDPFQFAVVAGNANLKNQSTRSFDFRWEWIDKSSNVLSASVFYKAIDNQLQRVFKYQSQGSYSTSPEFPVISFQNDPNQGRVYGVELEVRRNLGQFWLPLKNLNIGTNVLLAASSIKKNPERLNASRTNDRRSPETTPIYEQAPYSINTTLDYENAKNGLTITTSFNMVGERLIQVQLDGTPDIFDRPVGILDIVFSKQLGKRFIVKGFAKNVLDPTYRQVYANAGNNGLYHGTMYIYRQYKKGSEFSLGLTYKLF